MFEKGERKKYRDTANAMVFSHISFALWAVICSDFVVTLILSFYSAKLQQNNLDLLSAVMSGNFKILAISAIVMVMAELVNYPLAFCARRAFLVLSRSNSLQPIPWRQVFTPFLSVEFLLKGSAIMLLNSLLVYIGCFGMFILALPISYACSMAVFIFADNPSISPVKALALSFRMMKGKKWGLFLTVLPLILLQMAINMFLGNLPLLATMIISVIQAIQAVTTAVVYNEIRLREIQTTE